MSINTSTVLLHCNDIKQICAAVGNTKEISVGNSSEFKLLQIRTACQNCSVLTINIVGELTDFPWLIIVFTVWCRCFKQEEFRWFSDQEIIMKLIVRFNGNYWKFSSVLYWCNPNIVCRIFLFVMHSHELTKGNVYLYKCVISSMSGN
jgi:hypothetical protein